MPQLLNCEQLYSCALLQGSQLTAPGQHAFPRAPSAKLRRRSPWGEPAQWRHVPQTPAPAPAVSWRLIKSLSRSFVVYVFLTKITKEKRRRLKIPKILSYR